MKKLLLMLTFILFSFSAKSSQICEINYSTLVSFVSMKKKFNFDKLISKEREAIEETTLNLFYKDVNSKLYLYDLDDVIRKKCLNGNILALYFFHSEYNQEITNTNPVLIEQRFNSLISRVCDRNKNIRQSIKENFFVNNEAFFFKNEKGISTFLDCVYVDRGYDKREIMNRKPLKSYEGD